MQPVADAVHVEDERVGAPGRPACRAAARSSGGSRGTAASERRGERVADRDRERVRRRGRTSAARRGARIVVTIRCTWRLVGAAVAAHGLLHASTASTRCRRAPRTRRRRAARRAPGRRRARCARRRRRTTPRARPNPAGARAISSATESWIGFSRVRRRLARGRPPPAVLERGQAAALRVDDRRSRTLPVPGSMPRTFTSRG